MSTTQHDDGGPAYPVPGLNNDADFNGMSLRDHFAGLAMQGMLIRPGSINAMDEARFAYLMADAMLAARKERS